MIDSYFNTFNKEIQNQNESKTETKDKRKTLVIIMIMIIGQTMCILNTLINNFTMQTFKIAYPLLYSGGFFFLFFIVWMCINRKITSPKRYYYLIVILETQSFFFDYLANYSYTFQIELISNNKDNNAQSSAKETLFELTDETIVDKINEIDPDNKFIKSYPAYIQNTPRITGEDPGLCPCNRGPQGAARRSVSEPRRVRGGSGSDLLRRLLRSGHGSNDSAAFSNACARRGAHAGPTEFVSS